MSYRPLQVVSLFSIATPFSLTGTLTRTSLKSYMLKGGTMGLNDVLEIWSLWSFTNSANSKLPQVAFGNTNIVSATVTTADSLNRPQWIWNRNSLSSQLYYAAGQVTGTGNTSGAPATMALNTANDILIEFLGTLVDTSETITLEAAHIKLFKF